MKTLIAVSVVAVMALTSGAQAGGFFSKRSPILTNITGVVVGVTTRDVNVLNANTVAVGNNSTVLSGNANGNANGTANGVLGNTGLLNGVLNGNGLLGLGGQNRRGY